MIMFNSKDNLKGVWYMDMSRYFMWWQSFINKNDLIQIVVSPPKISYTKSLYNNKIRLWNLYLILYIHSLDDFEWLVNF